MNTSPPTLIEWLTAIGAVATPILLTLLAGIGWTIQRRIERSQKIEEELRDRSRKLEEELREDRLKAYNEILEPFIILLTKDEGLASERLYRGKNKADIATEKIISLAYRQAAFKLSLFASYSVVKAYNSLMQFFYERGTKQVQGIELNSREGGMIILHHLVIFYLKLGKALTMRIRHSIISPCSNG